MSNTTESTHVIIDRIITGLNKEAVGYFNSLESKIFIGRHLMELGFKNIPNVAQANAVNEVEFERAKLQAFFGTKVLTTQELNNICNTYNLTVDRAENFKDAIPDENVQDILGFVEKQRAESWTLGTSSRDLFCIPLVTPFMVVAPVELFVEPIDWEAIRKAEREEKEAKAREKWLRWLREDPIVYKTIYKFDPYARRNGDESTTATQYHAVVTAWGFEGMLLDGNASTPN